MSGCIIRVRNYDDLEAEVIKEGRVRRKNTPHTSFETFHRVAYTRISPCARVSATSWGRLARKSDLMTYVLVSR